MPLPRRARLLALATAALFTLSVLAACYQDRPGADIPGPGVELEHDADEQPQAPPSTLAPSDIAPALDPATPPVDAPQDEDDPAKAHAPPGVPTQDFERKSEDEITREYGLVGEYQLIAATGPHVVIQKGHAFRRRGATGTRREQEATSAIGDRMAQRLVARGYRVTLVLADDGIPASDAFVALHTDGASNPGRRGASVGYPDSNGGELARAWKAAHQAIAGYDGGFLNDNYTAALRGYYGFGRSRARFEFLAEHATTTNRQDEDFVFSRLDQIAEAHAVALDTVFARRGARPAPVVGPAPPPPPRAAPPRKGHTHPARRRAVIRRRAHTTRHCHRDRRRPHCHTARHRVNSGHHR